MLILSGLVFIIGASFFRWGFRSGYQRGFDDAQRYRQNDSHSTFIINDIDNNMGGFENGIHEKKEAYGEARRGENRIRDYWD